MHKVSIGLPVYNGENYVSYAIESVQRQTFEDWELIINDNGSDDATAAICAAYAATDSRIQFHRCEENQGAAWNFNRVFELATGKYFRWLSHDDYMLPTLLEKSFEVMEANPHLALCAAQTGAIGPQGFRILDADGKSDLHCQGLNAEHEELRRKLSASESVVDRYGGILLYSRRCNEIYGLSRRELMLQTQLHPSYCGGEKVLLTEFAVRGEIYEIPEMLFFVRWHTERFTSNSSTREQDEHMQPQQKGRWTLPHQYRASLGYLQLLGSSKLSFVDRVRCSLVWLRFALQLSKWKSILLNTFRGQATWAEIEGEICQGERVHELECQFTAENVRLTKSEAMAAVVNSSGSDSLTSPEK